MGTKYSIRVHLIKGTMLLGNRQNRHDLIDNWAVNINKTLLSKTAVSATEHNRSYNGLLAVSHRANEQSFCITCTITRITTCSVFHIRKTLTILV